MTCWLKAYGRQHSKLEHDLGRLAEAPDLMGDHVPELRDMALPIFKTRCKDSCHRIGASGAWRIYSAVHKPAAKLFLLFLHHKKEYENPRPKFLQQKIEQAMASASKGKPNE